MDPALFATGVPVDTEPGRRPRIVYPLDGSIHPMNLSAHHVAMAARQSRTRRRFGSRLRRRAGAKHPSSCSCPMPSRWARRELRNWTPATPCHDVVWRYIARHIRGREVRLRIGAHDPRQGDRHLGRDRDPVLPCGGRGWPLLPGRADQPAHPAARVRRGEGGAHGDRPSRRATSPTAEVAIRSAGTARRWLLPPPTPGNLTIARYERSRQSHVRAGANAGGPGRRRGASGQPRWELHLGPRWHQGRPHGVQCRRRGPRGCHGRGDRRAHRFSGVVTRRTARSSPRARASAVSRESSIRHTTASWWSCASRRRPCPTALDAGASAR